MRVTSLLNKLRKNFDCLNNFGFWFSKNLLVSNFRYDFVTLVCVLKNDIYQTSLVNSFFIYIVIMSDTASDQRDLSVMCQHVSKLQDTRADCELRDRPKLEALGGEHIVQSSRRMFYMMLLNIIMLEILREDSIWLEHSRISKFKTKRAGLYK